MRELKTEVKLDNERQSTVRRNENDILMMSDSTKRIEAQESRGFPPVGSVHRWRNRAPRRFKRFYNLRASQEVCPKTPKEPP